ncbi:hypothetical protein D9758_018273 [Tetrapyrgos nigripes]|uniref:DUF659 domain-containing protein n=1 Tax=Tetrapyrgos nigripes TaxID=182062 RepID=A0A8H5FAV6_9AGAR|nr:hypothetical protein D9758_018273 [Tetrapyrgos nigripes]
MNDTNDSVAEVRNPQKPLTGLLFLLVKIVEESWELPERLQSPQLVAGSALFSKITQAGNAEKLVTNQAEIAVIASQDAERVESGQMEVARTAQQTEAEIVSGNTRGQTILCSANSTMLNHFKVCEYQTQETQNMANTKNATQPHPSAQPRTSPRRRSANAPSHVVGASRPPSHASFSHPSVVDLNSLLIAPITSEYNQQLPPDDTISNITKPIIASISDSYNLGWSDDQQRRFEELLIHITASAGLPLSWVDNLEFDAFVYEFIPGAKPVSWKTLSRHVLPNVIKQVRMNVATSLSGREVTLQADRWTGLNHMHLMAFMASTDTKIYTVDVFDTSKDRKTVEEFLKLIEKCYEKVTQGWGAQLVGFVSDASGESRKACWLLAKKYPELAVLDCFAHQVNLVVRDYFSKSKAQDLQFTDSTTELITWLRSKSLILAHLQGKTVIRAVLTRWTVHYQAFVRLVELRPKLLQLVHHDEGEPEERKQIMKTGNVAAQRKAQEMMEVIKNHIIQHLEPLAIAANVIQAAHCRLDQVLLTFGCLFYQFSHMDVADTCGCNAIVASLESRWHKTDQEIFVAAVLLNPIFCNTLFRLAGIQDILTWLWWRFYPQEPLDFEFSNHLDDYLHSRGFFINIQSRIQLELGNAEANLFSVFGNTLTKLRNRLGKQTLTDLTELKMHIRDKHLQSAASTWLKRRFEARGTRAAAEYEAQQSQLQEALTPEPPSNTYSDTGVQSDTSSSDTASSFRSMMERNVAAAAEDDEDNNPVIPSSPTFNQRWINMYLCRSKEANSEEMALYELLEAENVGDEGGLIDMDGTNEDLLVNY